MSESTEGELCSRCQINVWYFKYLPLQMEAVFPSFDYVLRFLSTEGERKGPPQLFPKCPETLGPHFSSHSHIRLLSESWFM